MKRSTLLLPLLLVFGGLFGWLAAQDKKTEPSVAPDRTVLPIELKATGGVNGSTVADSKMGKIKAVTAPKGAPNVEVVLLDDVGFGAIGTFGGPVPTPATDALAKEGLRYKRFQTAAQCSSSRAALLTGRNHHSVGTGIITEYAASFDGYNSIIPKSASTVDQVLRMNGYNTACFG